MEVTDVLIESFGNWLITLGYADSTVYTSKRHVNDFFFYLKEHEIRKLEKVKAETIIAYHNYLQERKNKRQTGSLSENYIISNINALKRLSKYLQETEQGKLSIEIKCKGNQSHQKSILTKEEVKLLYKACDHSILGIRDRAILGIYYGCGLRRSEGIALNVSDIHLGKNLVHVRKGKGSRERYVPLSLSVKEDLENYIYVARNQILSFKNQKQEALFLSMRSKRISENALLLRIHKLKEAASITKEVGLHSLRHSIATHLLQSGMKLEEVSQFLGHSSLESTQIYTHLAHEVSL
ncbi:tyrosine-type recombinase/integrase [Marinifilum fragile]|uniref:tyrosine-type recombinase/integrase n=1 Tax=Marinifilum fragile TaxID=570161 RepID=UPI002AA7E354|nr:tyrosine-type recombinase/integrase [Marinifilum fragile]